MLRGVQSGSVGPSQPPPIKNIERWWSAESLEFLCRLKAAIDLHAADVQVTDLLRVALCRTLIAVSNAAFNHQSMSFKNKAGAESVSAPQLTLLGAERTEPQQFRNDVSFVIETASENPQGRALVLRGDSRNHNVLHDNGIQPFDLLVTSPPYPNRMSYIRELRPYMYWLSYLVEAREAGDLDWEAIGGTWGIATSRLNDWKPSASAYIPEYLFPILDRVRASHEKNGVLMANYIHKYFEDISEHLRSVRPFLNPGAAVHYIVGNSTFYGHVVPVERLYVDLLTHVGFEGAKWTVVRKRNSKQELLEFVVSAKWPGAPLLI